MRTAIEIFQQHFPHVFLSEIGIESIQKAMDEYRSQPTESRPNVALLDVTDEQWMNVYEFGFGGPVVDFSVKRTKKGDTYEFMGKSYTHEKTIVDLQGDPLYGDYNLLSIQENGLFENYQDSSDYYVKSMPKEINSVAIVDYLRSLGVQFKTNQ